MFPSETKKSQISHVTHDKTKALANLFPYQHAQQFKATPPNNSLQFVFANHNDETITMAN